MVDHNQLDQDDLAIDRENVNTSFAELLVQRFTRRQILRSTNIAALSFMLQSLNIVEANNSLRLSSLTFSELEQGLDDKLHVAEGYNYQVLLRWGDPVYEDSPAFNPETQTSESQEKQFGYNNDFVTYTPLSYQSKSSANGLLIVNHEYVSSTMMYPGSPRPSDLTEQQIDTEIFAHGLTIVEIQKQGRKWKTNLSSKFNHRITPHTKMNFSGPASGHDRLRTAFTTNGKSCIGTFGNCAGCLTPWGTVLTAEENIQTYFMGQANKTREHENYQRFGLKGDATVLSFWGNYHERWNLDKHPQTGLHAGWIVELDPYDPEFIPIKRTALGRCKHEGCDVHINIDGRAVVYMGDDQAFEYIYRFVSRQKYVPGDREQNFNLLDEGELSVAEFTEQGTVIWHPLIWGHGPHTKNYGFNSQADVVIDMRKAADLVGATPMDRPEEIKVNPVTGTVFAVLTNNVKRGPLSKNLANPRAFNQHGHILELIPPGQDHASKEFKWEVFILAGNPNEKLHYAYYHSALSESGWFSNPDNCTFDKSGNIWIATDGFYRRGSADGIWVGTVQGNEKALTKHFLRAPKAAEICSPCFTPDQKTMFCSVQHPGEDSSFDKPSTRWPDFNDKLPPRPSVIAITHDQDEIIGT